MATNNKADLFLKELKSSFNEQEINKIARQTGAWQRFRKITPMLFLHAAIWFFCSESKRAIASIVDEFILATGEKISYGSLHPRFTANLVEFLKRIIQTLICKEKNTCKLKNFSDLIIADTTVFKLHKNLTESYPGSGRTGCKAAVKIHMQTSPFRNAPVAINISPERTDDRKYLNIDEEVRGRLLLFDRGYFSYKIFSDICKYGGFFVCRYFSRSKLRIVKDLTKTGENCDLSEKNLSRLIKSYNGEILDFEVEISLEKTRSIHIKGGRLSLRFTGIWNSDSNRYNTYISNLDISFTPEEISRIYRARWEIELVFKELKSYYHINAFSGKKQEVVESLIYIAILTMISTRNIYCLLSKLANSDQLRPDSPRILRMADVIRLIGVLLHVLLLSNNLQEIKAKLYHFAENALKDPNKKRPRNIEGLVAQFGC